MHPIYFKVKYISDRAYYTLKKKGEEEKEKEREKNQTIVIQYTSNTTI